MPKRKTPLVTEKFYHIINRGIWSLPIFDGKRDYSRFFNVMRYYQNPGIVFSYSKFLSLPSEDRLQMAKFLEKNKKVLVEIIAYCFMPNHIHFLLKQARNQGISKFVGLLTNSYTRYINTKKERVGPIFQGRFKAVRVETDEQLLHLSRYIHLNPYSSHFVSSYEDLMSYSYSSFPEYLGRVKTNLCSKEIVLENFKNKTKYKEFVLDQADYQKKLEQIKYLVLESN